MMDMSRNFTSSLMMTASGSHGSLSRTLESSLGDSHSPSGAQQDDGKMSFSKVIMICMYLLSNDITIQLGYPLVVYKDDTRH